ncbi:MAG: hypothetical protein FRX49_04368 [Trebouxia sp. A1-2]|nr:MAG: hypothetical protein FRX49_04368 [Trebouxia sp. A1-2]
MPFGNTLYQEVPVEAKVQSLPARLRTDTKPHSLQQLLSDEKHSGQKHSSSVATSQQQFEEGQCALEQGPFTLVVRLEGLTWQQVPQVQTGS